MGSFLAMFVNEDENTVNHKTAPNFLIKGKHKSLKNVTVSSPRPSGDIKTFLKEQRIREKKFLQKKNALYPIMILNQTYLSSTKIIYYLFLSIILLA